MFFVAAQSEREDVSQDLNINSNGMIYLYPGEKQAVKAMRAAEIAYHKELGIYKPTLTERVKDFLNIA